MNCFDPENFSVCLNYLNNNKMPGKMIKHLYNVHKDILKKISYAWRHGSRGKSTCFSDRQQFLAPTMGVLQWPLLVSVGTCPPVHMNAHTHN